MKSDSTLAIFDYLLQEKKHSATVICIEDGKLAIGVQFLEFLPHTRLKEIHKIFSFFVYFNSDRRYVFLRFFVPIRWICRLEIRIPG